MRKVFSPLLILLAIGLAAWFFWPKPVAPLLDNKVQAQAQRDSLWAQIVHNLDSAFFHLQDQNSARADSLRARAKITDKLADSAERVSPGEMVWRPLFYRTRIERDSALAGWDDARRIIFQKDSIVQEAWSRVQVYHGWSEARIDSLESALEHKGLRLFGIPLPEPMVVAGMNDRFRFGGAIGLGYTLKFPRKHVKAPSAPVPTIPSMPLKRDTL